MTIQEQLNHLHELRQQLDALSLHVRDLTAAVITDAQRQEIAAIELEYAPSFDAVNERIADLEGSIKAAVIEAGATVKGQYYQAVYMKGRVSYDTKALDGYSLAHPELLAYRNEGQPSVSLRSVTK